MLTIKLKEILKERNMTMTELHKETGISKKHLSQMANHKTGGHNLFYIGEVSNRTRHGLCRNVYV